MRQIYKCIKPIIEVVDTLLKPIAWCTAIFIFVANFWADKPQSAIFGLVQKIQSLVLPEPRIVEQTKLFVYYELGEGNTLTNEGRLSPRDPNGRRTYEALETGDQLYASSTVRIRDKPTASGNIVGRLAAGDCARVIEAEYPLTPDQLGSAITGGWIQITDCASGFVGSGGF